MRRSFRIVGLLLAIGFVVITLLSPAMAGERTTGVWEGIAIGLGAGLVLNTISHPPVVYYQPPPAPVLYYEYYVPTPPPVVITYTPAPAVVVVKAKHHVGAYGPPYGKAHGFWKKVRHRHYDD